MSISGDAFGRLEPQLAWYERSRIVGLQAEDMRAYLPADLDQIAKALRDHERDLSAAALNKRVGRNRCSVRKAPNLSEFNLVTCGEIRQARNDDLRRVGGS